MIRGTTAQFKFRLPYDVKELDIVKITFWQPGNSGPSTSRPLPIVKLLSQCSFSNFPNELSVFLNKEETMRFSDNKRAYVQLRATTIDGSAFASKQEIIAVYPVYDDSILDENLEPTPSPDENGIVILDGSPVV